jgi:hypothetical protein
MFQLTCPRGSWYRIDFKVPGQLSDAIDGVIGDSGQTHSLVGCRITVGQFSCSYQVRLSGIVLTDALFVHGRLLPQGVV